MLQHFIGDVVDPLNRDLLPEAPVRESGLATLSVPQQILRAASAYDGRVALVDGVTKRAISYRQLILETRHAAKALVQRGLQKGEVVCLYSHNQPEYAVAVLAVTLAGGVVSMVTPETSVEGLTARLQATQTKILLTNKRLLKTALLAAGQSAVRHLYSFDSAQGVQHFAELFETVMLDDERPTEALLDVQRDLLAWWQANGGENLRRTHAEIAAACQQAGLNPESPPQTIGMSAVSLADGEPALLRLLQALWQGDMVVT